jgi:chromosome segregation ATPase
MQFSPAQEKPDTVQAIEQCELAAAQLKAASAVLVEAESKLVISSRGIAAATSLESAAQQELKTVKELEIDFQEKRDEKCRLEEAEKNVEAKDRELLRMTTNFRRALCHGLRLNKEFVRTLRDVVDSTQDEQVCLLHLSWLDRIFTLQKALVQQLTTKQKSLTIEAESLTLACETGRIKKDQYKAQAIEQSGLSPADQESEGWKTIQGILGEIVEGGVDNLDETFSKRMAHVLDLLQEATGDAALPDKLKATEHQLSLLDDQLQEAMTESLGSSEKVRSMHSAWLNDLRAAVAKLSVVFGANCQQLGVQGTIELHEAGAAYKDYGLNLISSFHGTELTKAAAATQSGGEKSVTTILFLLAMQRSSPCPFRIIDEINQGMDETNERRVMHLIGASTTPSAEQRAALLLPEHMPGMSHKRVRPRPGALQAMASSTSDTVHHVGHQYFMLTPKLLPDLHYPDHVRIHTVFNGAAVPPVAYKTVSLTELVKRRRNAVDMGQPVPSALHIASEAQRQEAEANLAARAAAVAAMERAKARRADDRHSF